MTKATCHCGNIQIEITQNIDSITQCTCSICRRYAALWIYCTSESTTIIDPYLSAKPYLWGDKQIEFYHCSNCGCLTHYESCTRTTGSRVAVNARMIAPAEITDIEIKTFDGADTWMYLDK